MTSPRTHRITILLTDDEHDAWQQVRNATIPEGMAARIMLLDAVDFLQSKGLQQRKAIHTAKPARTSPARQNPTPEASGEHYDFTDSQ